MISHLLLAAFVWLAPAPAAPTSVAQAGQVAADGPARAAGEAVDRAAARVTAGERRRAELAAERDRLAGLYGRQLAEIDRLKERRPSWRRDRLLRGQMAESQGTARALETLDKQMLVLDERLREGRKALVAAIDVELRSAPAQARRTQLERLRGRAASALRRDVRKIVLPDLTVDPLADPEELEHQAALIAQVEKELAAELAQLEAQSQRYHRMARLRSAHQRADELGGLDDDRPRRSTGRVSGGRSVDLDPLAEGGGPPPEFDDGPAADPQTGFEADPAVVLADVVDAGTLDALRRAERSNDPLQKARAAERARDQVGARLERLRKHRALVEARARTLQR